MNTLEDYKKFIESHKKQIGTEFLQKQGIIPFLEYDKKLDKKYRIVEEYARDLGYQITTIPVGYDTDIDIIFLYNDNDLLLPTHWQYSNIKHNIVFYKPCIEIDHLVFKNIYSYKYVEGQKNELRIS